MKYDSDDMGCFTLIGFISGIILTFTFFSLSWHYNDLDFKREAIVKNCAEWVVDEYGRTTFNFKDHTDKKNLAEKD